MTLKFLIDMNLSPQWIEVFERQGWTAVHWSSVGDPRATDAHILSWAKKNQFIVFTHDLDFGTLLAATRSSQPSVIQIRAQDVLPEHLEGILLRAVFKYRAYLEQGALIIVREAGLRARILPLKP